MHKIYKKEQYAETQMQKSEDFVVLFDTEEMNERQVQYVVVSRTTNKTTCKLG